MDKPGEAKKAHASEEVVQMIVDALEKDGVIADSYEFAQHKGRHHANEVVPSIKSLEAGNKVATTPITVKTWGLTEEAESYLLKGSPEAQIWTAVPAEGVDQKVLIDKVPNGQIGFSQAMKNKWLRLEKAAPKAPAEPAPADPKGGKKKEAVEAKVFRAVETITDQLQNDLRKVKEAVLAKRNEPTAQGVDVDALKKRKLVVDITINSVKVTKGPMFGKNEVLHTELTAEMLASGDWKNLSFKPVNANAKGKESEGGHLHPLMKVRTQFREILLELGFEEMPTDRWVESSFWDFDALFTPQQHPARDSHDTFFIKDPANTKDLPADYVNGVKEMHEKGGHHSIGWRYDWKESEARKNILRTHTTAISARMLYRLAKEGFKPAKYFSIDRVFRNEAMDATHLCEFHQIEGVVCDRGLTLGDLRFKPAFNPYTEPSMEVFAQHPERGWVEVGNSGVFRPEMLRPMGLPDDVQVIAWGLGLERPTMILYKISNIRDLFGHRVPLQSIRNNPICRLDKPLYNPDKEAQKEQHKHGEKP